MNNIDIFNYLDVYYKSKINPTKERSKFIEQFMPSFLKQMDIIYHSDIKRFNDIYQQIANFGESVLLNELRNFTKISIPYNGGARKRSIKRRKINRRVISRK